MIEELNRRMKGKSAKIEKYEQRITQLNDKKTKKEKRQEPSSWHAVWTHMFQLIEKKVVSFCFHTQLKSIEDANKVFALVMDADSRKKQKPESLSEQVQENVVEIDTNLGQPPSIS